MATILIVDDHPALRLVVKTQLSQVLGVSNILEADNGQAAIEAAKQFEPDLAILDLDIPRISGLDVIPRLKLIYPPIRILVISGQDQATFAPRVRQAGAQGFVSKMQDMKEIVRCVEAVMAGYMVPRCASSATCRRSPCGRTKSGLSCSRTRRSSSCRCWSGDCPTKRSGSCYLSATRR